MKFKTDKPVKVYGGDAVKLTINQEYYDESIGSWHVDFKLENISDITIYNPTVDFSVYSEFMYCKAVTLVYPNGVVKEIPWKEGKADSSNAETFLPAFIKDNETDKFKLKPGECLTGHYTAYKKSTAYN